jgi:general secretion pathway protein A
MSAVLGEGMYLSFYHLKKEPFHTTPDPEFLFLTSSNREAFASIIYNIEKKKGFTVIIGEAGVGKTTILRAIWNRPINIV